MSLSPPLMPCQEKQVSLLWLMHVYHDFSAADVALAQLRTHYPHSRILIIADGDRDEKFREFEKKYAAQVLYGERLMQLEKGNQILKRMLDLFLDQPDADVLIKIDPDTYIRRPIQFIPQRKDTSIWGTLQKQVDLRSGNERISLQGGALLIPRGAAELLICGPSLDVSEWAISSLCRHRANFQKLTSIDWHLGATAIACGIPMRSHPEIISRWKTFWPVDILRFHRTAILHPWKFTGLGVFSMFKSMNPLMMLELRLSPYLRKPLFRQV